MKWRIHWKYKLGIYAVFAIGAVLYFILAMQLASVEIERDALREEVAELERRFADVEDGELHGWIAQEGDSIIADTIYVGSAKFWPIARGTTKGEVLNEVR